MDEHLNDVSTVHAVEPPKFYALRHWLDKAKDWPGKVLRRMAIGYLVWAARKSNYVSFAEMEMRAAGWDMEATDGPDLWMRNHLFALLAVFANEGHSGSSAAWARQVFTKLSAFEPLAPLTGEPDEWMDVSDTMYQNRRCSHVFKDGKDGKDGRAYDIDGVVWRDKDGCTYTNRASRVFITFPYYPKTEYRDAPPDEDNREAA